MIKRTVHSLLIGICLLGAAARADGLGLFAAYLDTSGNDAVSGIGLRGRGGSELLYFELRGTYFEDIPEVDLIVDQELSLLPIDFGFGWQTTYEAPLQLYGGGGVTYYFLDVSDGSVDNALGYYFEVGGEMEIFENFGNFFEALWRQVETRSEEGSRLNKDDLNVNGGAVHIGIMLRR